MIVGKNNSMIVPGNHKPAFSLPQQNQESLPFNPQRAWPRSKFYRTVLDTKMNIQKGNQPDQRRLHGHYRARAFPLVELYCVARYMRPPSVTFREHHFADRWYILFNSTCKVRLATCNWRHGQEKILQLYGAEKVWVEYVSWGLLRLEGRV